MGFEAGDRVQVKRTNNEKVPYSGYKGTVAAIDTPDPYDEGDVISHPVIVNLDNGEKLIPYTEKELKAI